MSHEANAASSATARALTADDMPLWGFSRDAGESVPVPGGVELGLRVGIAHRPPVWFESAPLPIETTAAELRAMWGAAPFTVYLYALTDRGRFGQPLRQWQVKLEPETERDIGHEPWPFVQGANVPPPVAKLHRDREVLRERLGSTTPDPLEAWSLVDDASSYDRAPPAHDRYRREMAPDARGSHLLTAPA